MVKKVVQWLVQLVSKMTENPDSHGWGGFWFGILDLFSVGLVVLGVLGFYCLVWFVVCCFFPP